MKAVVASCPFNQWGMDLVGPMPSTPRQNRFLIVVVDYSKWVEAEPLASITEGAVIQFLWQDILWQYGVPRWLISVMGASSRVAESGSGARISRLSRFLPLWRTLRLMDR